MVTTETQDQRICGRLCVLYRHSIWQHSFLEKREFHRIGFQQSTAATHRGILNEVFHGNTHRGNNLSCIVLLLFQLRKGNQIFTTEAQDQRVFGKSFPRMEHVKTIAHLLALCEFRSDLEAF